MQYHRDEMSPLDRRAHWEKVYTEKEPAGVSWYQRRPDMSLALIEAAGAGKDAGIIDVGGGASVLVDCLLDAGYSSLAVLDVSGASLDAARSRLGSRAP